MARGRKPAASLADTGGEGKGRAPDPPDGMTSAALDKWLAIVPLIAELVALAETDVDALRSFCEAAALRDRARKDLERSELVLITPNGASQINPLITIAERAEAKMMRLAERFGLDPASRQRLKVATGKSKGSAFAEFMRRKPGA